jgi:hypothetical protein
MQADILFKLKLIMTPTLKLMSKFSNILTYCLTLSAILMLVLLIETLEDRTYSKLTSELDLLQSLPITMAQLPEEYTLASQQKMTAIMMYFPQT